MKKILLADDEEIIRLGISTLIPWEELDLELVYIAENGRRALNYILSNPVDIVVTDIRMPVMDGLELIQNCVEHDLCSRFILLTGYSEFEYAQSAMKYGVRHYLIKPTDESQIIQALKELCTEIDTESSHERLFSHLVKTAPSNFFRELLTQTEGNPTTISRSRFAFYKDMLHINERPCALVSIHLERGTNHEIPDPLLYFILENISTEVFTTENCLCSTTLNECLFLLITELSEMEAEQRIPHKLSARFR